MSEESDPLLPVLLEAVKAAENTAWRTNAMAKLPVRFPDGKYKNTALTAGDPELLFTGVRPGKRADYIFEFEPVDDRPYKTVEMDESKVFSLLGGFETLIVRAMGYGADAMLEETDPKGALSGDEIVLPTFGKARALFKRDHARREKAKREAEAQAAVVTDASRYATNPLWGAF